MTHKGNLADSEISDLKRHSTQLFSGTYGPGSHRRKDAEDPSQVPILRAKLSCCDHTSTLVMGGLGCPLGQPNLGDGHLWCYKRSPRWELVSAGVTSACHTTSSAWPWFYLRRLHLNYSLWTSYACSVSLCAISICCLREWGTQTSNDASCPLKFNQPHCLVVGAQEVITVQLRKLLFRHRQWSDGHSKGFSAVRTSESQALGSCFILRFSTQVLNKLHQWDINYP